jgi:hypothetical protein
MMFYISHQGKLCYSIILILFCLIANILSNPCNNYDRNVKKRNQPMSLLCVNLY